MIWPQAHQISKEHPCSFYDACEEPFPLDTFLTSLTDLGNPSTVPTTWLIMTYHDLSWLIMTYHHLSWLGHDWLFSFLPLHPEEHFENGYDVLSLEQNMRHLMFMLMDGWTREKVHSKMGLQDPWGCGWRKHGKQELLDCWPSPTAVGIACSTSNWTMQRKVPTFLRGGRTRLRVQEGENIHHSPQALQ